MNMSLRWGAVPVGDGQWEGWIDLPMPDSVCLQIRAAGNSQGHALARTIIGAADAVESVESMGFGFLASLIPDIINTIAQLAQGITSQVAQGRKDDARRSLGAVPTKLQPIARALLEQDKRDAESLGWADEGDVLGQYNPYGPNPHANPYGNPYAQYGAAPQYGYGAPTYDPYGGAYGYGYGAPAGYGAAYADPYGGYGGGGYGYPQPAGYGYGAPTYDPYGGAYGYPPADPYGGAYGYPPADPYGGYPPPAGDPYGPVVTQVQVTPPPARQRAPQPAPGGGARPGAPAGVVVVRPAPARR